jgi:hypothetical protein
MLHFGLFFSPAQVQTAQREREQEPLLSAWMFLRDREQSGVVEAQWNGLRYLFAEDNKAGELAVHLLDKFTDDEQSAANNYLDAVFETLILVQTFEMVREHPVFAPDARRRWLDFLTARLPLLENSPDRDTHVETLWMALLNLAGGIALENEALIQSSRALFQTTVAEDIRPQGYIPKAVEGKDGGSLFRQFLSVSALALMAEAASQIEIDLWGYSVRGVSVVTGAMYPIYYFYTPEKWKWDVGISLAEAQNLFRQYGGYLEMLYRRTRHKDLIPLLEDLRPIYDPRAGGLTTLTHGVVEKQRRGLFR